MVVITLMLMAAYEIPPRTLAGLMKDKVEEGYSYRTVYKTKANGEYTMSNIKITDPKGIEVLWDFLSETEASFKTITHSPNLKDGDVWYEITDMQHTKSIQITDSGEVYVMAFHIPQLNIVYSISDEELKDFFTKIKGIREMYGEK